MKNAKMPKVLQMLVCLALVLLLAGCGQLAQVLPGGFGGDEDTEVNAGPADDAFSNGDTAGTDEPQRENLPIALQSFFGLESDPLASVAYVNVNVNHCEYGEPTQTITDPKAVASLCSAASNMQVIELADRMVSTDTYIDYSFYDKDDNYIYGFSIQNQLLMESDGRYSLAGLESLFAVSGVMLPNDFSEYYQQQEQLEEEAKLNPQTASFPVSLFEAEGYHGLDYRDTCNGNANATVRAYIDWSDIDVLSLEDPALTEELYAALSEIQATGVADAVTEEKLPSPDRFRLTVSWSVPGDTIGRSVTFGLWNDTLQADDVNYMLSGTERLYAIPEFAEFVAYMKAYVK